MAYGAAALDRCLEGVTVPTIVHLCYGYPGGAELQHHYTYPELLDRLMRTQISGFTVEFARSNYDPAILKPYRDRLIMFGCIDPGNTPAPTVDAVKRRIASALEHLDPRRMLSAPDCGLMTISRDLAREKLQVMVTAARGAAEGYVRSELIRAGVDHLPQVRAVLHPLHLRSEPAVATDPFFHARWIMRH